jgi:hypothetical protein
MDFSKTHIPITIPRIEFFLNLVQFKGSKGSFVGWGCNNTPPLLKVTLSAPNSSRSPNLIFWEDITLLIDYTITNLHPTSLTNIWEVGWKSLKYHSGTQSRPRNFRTMNLRQKSDAQAIEWLSSNRPAPQSAFSFRPTLILYVWNYSIFFSYETNYMVIRLTPQPAVN